MFKGSIVALITPFLNGAVDEDKLRQLVEFHIENGTDAIVPCGTTGESSTLDYNEHMGVIRIVIEQCRKRIPVIAGTGSNSTAEAIELSQKAKEAGADGVLLVTPTTTNRVRKGFINISGQLPTLLRYRRCSTMSLDAHR
jgi:4-hydroxy-tetrahydrodipicolinate synthase